MAKLIAGLGALFVYGSLGAASVGTEPTASSASLAAAGDARAESAHVAAERGTEDPWAAAPMGGMSKDEIERRQNACVRDWESDMDWCARTTKGREYIVCKKRAANRLADCMARID